LIGGIVEPGEEVADAVVREVQEETSVLAAPERITGVDTVAMCRIQKTRTPGLMDRQRLTPRPAQPPVPVDSVRLGIMSLAMTPAEREAFLADVHVAVVTVADDDGRGPLAVPLWYDYQPGGEIVLITDGNSRKAQLIRKAGRVTVCVQTQDMPYRYASVEGPVTAIEDTVTVEQRRELARRYLGQDGADGYVEATRDVTDRMCAIHIRPEHWLTRDYTRADV